MAPALSLPDGPATKATCRLAHADCLAYLATLPDDSIDLVLTDPPYLTTALDLDSGADFTPAIFLKALKELARVTKPNAWLFFFGSLRTHALTMQALGYPRFDYIWAKHLAALPSHNVRRPHLQHEQIYAWSNPALKAPMDLYFNKEVLRTHGHSKYYRRGMQSKKNTPYREQMRRGSWALDASESKDGSRHPTSLLFFPNKSGFPPLERTKHPTQKPRGLCRLIVEGYCPPAGIVLDPFAGSGTTLLAARAAGRHALGCEINPEYYQIACEKGAAGERLFEEPPAAAAAGRKQRGGRP